VSSQALVTTTQRGLYCLQGDFYIDPWEPVERAIITHAHADHARPGSDEYLCAATGAGVLQHRMGADADVTGIAYGEVVDHQGVQISFHPAGHVLGSAQVLLEYKGQRWVISGDFKRQADPTCTPFEPVPCHTFITEATFALPIYTWEPVSQVVDQIHAWWQQCASVGRPAVLGCYAFGKSQRLIAELRGRTDDPIWLHGAIENLNERYRESGLTVLTNVHRVADAPAKQDWAGQLVLSPPGAIGSRWANRFKRAEIALASGWMRVRGNRRWQSYDRGFALSDHADWPALLQTVEQTQASRVLVTHGTSEAFARFLREQRGIDAISLDTKFEGEGEH